MKNKADAKALKLAGKEDVSPPSCDGDGNCQRWLDRRLNYFWSQEQNHFFVTGRRQKICVKSKILVENILLW